jgi:predicted transcriptional regulator
MYGMTKTTVYLPEDLKSALGRTAEARGCSEAALIREAVRRVVDEEPPRPRIPLIERGLGDPTAARRVHELLDGFGQ